jgi:type 1 glutamine amidotransferase
VFLEIPDLRPVMQMKISCNLDSADGQEIRTDVYNTIHALGPAYGPRVRYDLEAPGQEFHSTIHTPSSRLKVHGPTVRLVDAKAEQMLGAADKSKKQRKLVLIAGKKSHGPGEHEYEKGARLLKQCLDTSPNVKGIKTEVVTNGWPDDPKVLEDADTLFLFCDGSDRDEKAQPLLQGDRLEQLGKLMSRGCGLVCIHYTVFVPTDRGGKQFQEWIGGYFDYDSHHPAAGAEAANQKNWYSRLGHATTNSTFLSPDHPISRGCKPFTTKTEYYWKMRFRENDDRLTPILTFDPAKVAPPVRESLVAWAVQRNNGGRGFAFTEGHFHSNWQVESFRRMVLNALLWTAGAEVPDGGVESKPPSE